MREKKKGETMRTKKVFSNASEVISAWFVGTKKEGRTPTGNIFFEGDVLYSYGYHFVLAIRLQSGVYLLNGDTYSHTTGAQQACVRHIVRNEKHFIVPFSALNSAHIIDTHYGAHVEDLKIEFLNKEPDRIVPTPTTEYPNRTLHLMGSSLFRQDFGDRYGYYLSGLDETAVDPWRSFFLIELTSEVLTVKDAYESLKPDAVKYTEAKGEDVLRQGEWFFVPARFSTNSLEQYPVRKQYELVHPVTNTGHHIVTNAVVVNDRVFCKGTCRHRPNTRNPEHKMVCLPVWSMAIPNVQKASWSAGGRID
jgi:hypothetical protein